MMFQALLDARADFVTTRDQNRFTARRRGNLVVVTPQSTGQERPVPMDAFIDGYLLLLENPSAGTPEIGGVNASYVLALSRIALEMSAQDG